MSAPGTSFAVIEVAGIGMRVSLTMDNGDWSVSGWRKLRGAQARTMTLFGSSRGRAPHLLTDDEGGPGLQVGDTYVGLPPRSLEHLRAFVASVVGTKPAVAA